MSLPLLEHFQRWLDDGVRRIGEIIIFTPDDWSEDHYGLCHVDEAQVVVDRPEDLESHRGYIAARSLMLWDDAGEYRPLPSSPDLRHGWVLHLDSLDELRLALDYFYPSALGMWRDHQLAPLEPQHFRDKLARQTGMYRSAKRIGDPRAIQLIKRVCNPESGCLKRILWQLDGETPIHNLPPSKQLSESTLSKAEGIPLLCKEACNILVAEARKEARKEVTKVS